MTNFSAIKCELSSSNPTAELETEVWLDNTKIFDGRIVEPRHIEYRFDDNIECEHELKFVLKNKTDQHTKVDDTGNIVSDSLIQIRNLSFDDIELGYIFNQLSQYQHNNNGNSDWVVEKCYGDIGCNGTVSFKFSTPVYLWLLENL